MARRPAHPILRPSVAGTALVAVLCLISLLSVLALSVVDAARRHGQLARNSFVALQEQEFADSAIRLAILRFGSVPEQSRMASKGATGSVFQVFGNTIAVSLSHESGRVDLNAADRDLLIAVFAANGFDEVQAQIFANRILDWRDGDDQRGPGGAERDDYLRVGSSFTPRNGPFESVDELIQVLGLAELDAGLLDAFTVHSHSASVREQVAQAAVLRGLAWADSKRLGGHTWLVQGNSPTRFGEGQSLAGTTVKLSACVPAKHPILCRVATVLFTGDQMPPALILGWRTVYQGRVGISPTSSL